MFQFDKAANSNEKYCVSIFPNISNEIKEANERSQHLWESKLFRQYKLFELIWKIFNGANLICAH